MEPVRYVLLILNKHRLPQIALCKPASPEFDGFFHALREEYFKSRGMLRSMFSVWRFFALRFRKGVYS
jgi:hypothetical protein